MHFVTPELDAGPIVSAARRCRCSTTTRPRRLPRAILAVEHEIYPEAVERVL